VLFGTLVAWLLESWGMGSGFLDLIRLTMSVVNIALLWLLWRWNFGEKEKV